LGTQDIVARLKERAAMFAYVESRSDSVNQSSPRLRAAALAVALAAFFLAAGLAGASSASASGATLVTQSAKGGVLKGGRLTLRGVSGRVTYVLNTGRRGTLSVRRLHRRLLLPGLPATGTLHVAGYRGGDEPSFRLSKPRRNAARHTVSYRAKRLDHKPLPKRAGRAAGFRPPRRFGAASLSIVPHPRLTGGDNGGNDCEAAVYVDRGEPFALAAQSWSDWPTDDWNPDPSALQTEFYGSGSWESDGGLWRGCSNTVNFQAVAEVSGYGGLFTITTRWPWGGSASGTCTVTLNSQHISCTQQSGVSPITWQLRGIN
jgi:hypothetical protein